MTIKRLSPLVNHIKREAQFVAAFVRSLPWVLTVAVVYIAVLVGSTYELRRATQLADFVAGFSAALAFLWLVAGFSLQSRQLRMQAEELRLQRIALEQQAKELRNSSKFSALTQIESILNAAKASVVESPIPIKQPQELLSLWTVGIRHWKPILESTDADTVMSNFQDWIKIEGIVRGYIAKIASALKIYLDHVVEQSYEQKPDEELIYIHQDVMKNAPFLSEVQGIASALSQFVFMTRPALDSMHLAGLYGSMITAGVDLFKDGAVEDMQTDLVKRNVPLPEILKVPLPGKPKKS